jgi:hypothetical protein
MVGAAFTANPSAAELLPNAFVALTVKLAVPIAVGVPLMTPVDPFSERPAGRDPFVTAHVIGVLPEAARVTE